MRKLTFAPGAARLGLLAAVLAAGPLAAAGTAAAATPAPAVVSPNVQAPSLGVLWNPTPNAGGQCGGPASQWVAAPDWTAPILIDTDSRPGGCVFALGVADPGDALAGLGITYTWQVSPGGDSGQCENSAQGYNQGTFNAPIEPFPTFGQGILDDTDNRAGYCDLTFAVTGRNDIGLDVQFYQTPNSAIGQCWNALPQGSYDTATVGSPVTIGLDTDDRPGGCYLSLRIEHLGFGPVHPAAPVAPIAPAAITSGFEKR